MAEESKTGNGMKVIVAMDGSQEAENAFNWYVKNLHQPRHEVILLHCVHHSPDFLVGTWTPLTPTELHEAFKKQDEEGKEICKDMEQLLQDMEAGGKVTAMRIDGEPGPSIVDTANELKASVIVVGSRGQGITRKTILGSVSDYIIHHANVPVCVWR